MESQLSVQASAAKRKIKRIARRLFCGVSRVVHGKRGLTRGVRILTYHRVEDDPSDPFAVAPEDFRREMEIISKSRAACALGDALDGLRVDRDLPPRIVTTFDDGTSDFLRAALPVLRKLGLPATLFVSPGRIGESGYLTWAELREITEQGVDVGSHGLDHQSLARLPIARARGQIIDSKRILEDRLGKPITAIAYPYGTRSDFNNAVKEEIRTAGYLCACTSINGINLPVPDFMELRRTKIEQDDMELFEGIVQGGIDGWAIIDRNLSMLQNRYE